MGKKIGAGPSAPLEEETGRAPRLIQIPVSQLDAAPWNYKKPSTPEVMDKLKASIARDASAGVLAVRRVDKRYEVCDGNHRLEAIKGLGWTVAWVEDFGDLSTAEAVVLAQRRNHQWYEDDTIALGQLFRDVVLPEIDLDALQAFMPNSRASLEALVAAAQFAWNEAPADLKATFSVPFTDVIKELWPQWLQYAAEKIGDAPSRLDAVELLLNIGVALVRKHQDGETDGGTE